MNCKAYRINVLHILNPHLIWAEVIHANKDNNEDMFEQIGLYGVLPLETELSILSNEISSSAVESWAPAATKILIEEIGKARSVKFQPIFIDDTNSIFTSKQHKFGEIIIKTLDNDIIKLTEILNKSYFSFKNEKSFKNKLLNGSLNTILNDVQKAQVITIINDNVLNKIKLNHGKIEKNNELEEDFFEDSNKSTELMRLTTENLDKHNAVLCSQDNDLLDPSNNKINKFFLTFEENATNIAVQSSDVSDMAELICADLDKAALNESLSSVEIEPQANEKAPQIDISPSKIIDNQNFPNNKHFIVNESFSSAEGEPPLNKSTLNQNTTDKTMLNENFSSAENNVQFDKNKQKISNLSSNKNYNNNTMDNDTITEFSNVNKTSKVEHVCKSVIYGPPEMSNELYKRMSQKYKDNKKATPSQLNNIIDNNKSDIYSTIDTKKQNEDFLNKDVNKKNDFPISSNTSLKSNKKDDYLSAKVDMYLKIKQKNESSLKPTSEKSRITKFKIPQYVPKHKITTEKPKGTDTSPSSEKTSRVDRLLKLQESKRNKAMMSSSVNGATSQIRKYVNYDSDNETTISSLHNRLNLDKQIHDEPDSKHPENDLHLHISHGINNVNVFNNIDLGVSKFIDRVVQPVLIVHSKMNKRFQPALDLRDIYFQSDIRVALGRLSVKRPKMLQTISWPYILRGFSMFMISPLGGGKTFGYLPSVCQLVANFKDDSEFSTSHGPLCIIVCATAKSVCYIEKICKSLLRTKGSVLSCFPGINERVIGNLLVNGCDIFICTPCALIRFLNLPRSPLSLKQLSICVLDDCERLDDVYLNEIKYFILKIKEILSKRTHKEQTVQYIVASRRWCPFMESLAKRAPNTVVSISAYQETILYSKTKTLVTFVKFSNKVKAAVQFIKEIDESKRTVIVCCTNEEVDVLHKKFKSLNYVVFAADHDMTVETLYELNKQWEVYDVPVIGPILICCDENLLHLNITNATYLLHYSLPDLYSTFCKRFAVLTDNYPSIFKQNEEDSCAIKIFIGEDNSEQLPKIVNFIKRCIKDIPEVINEMTVKILEERELIKAQSFVPICDKLLSFGTCADFWNCRERHSIFKQFDTPPDWLPKFGEVSFVVLDYINAVTYSARLISYTFQGKTTKYEQTAISLSLKMDMYYMNDNHKIPHGIPKIGDICAVSTTANHFSRCQVVKILNCYENGTPRDVVIKLIDEEKWERSKDIHLYHLPENFKNIKTYVVQIKLCGLQPKDHDVMFSDLARKQLKHLIDKNDSIFMRGNIIMSIGNIVIVDSVEACQKLTSSNEVVVRYSFKEELLKHHALINSNYCNSLKALCDKSKFKFINDYENHDTEDIRLSNLPNPTWAHFDDDAMSLIYFAYAENAEKFYVRLEKFQNCLDILTNDIQTYLSNNSKPKSLIKVGDIVLAKFPDDNLYYRGRIDDVKLENKLRCFFVDHGDWRFIHPKDVFDITEKLIIQLPFQAIECRLIGLRPFGEKWTEFSTNWLCDIGFEGGCNDLKELYVKYFLKEKAECTGGHKYSIVVIDTTGDTDVIVNDLMIDANLAKPVESEIHYLHEIKNYICKKEPNKLLVGENKSKKKSTLDINDENNLLNDIKYNDGCNNVFIENDNANKLLNDLKHKDMSLVEETKMSLLEKAWEEEAEPYLNKNYTRTVTDIITRNDMMANYIPKKPIRSVPLVEEDDLSDDWELQLDCENPTKIPAAFGFNIAPQQCNIDISAPSSECIQLQAIETPSCNLSNSTSSSIQIITPSNDIDILDSDDSLDPEELNSTLSSQDNIRKPKLYWDQQNNIVNIKFEILNLEKYKIKIKANRVIFSALVNDINYGFNIELYGVIVVTKCTHLLKGHRVYIKLEKLVKVDWRYLSKEDIKNSWIKYDPDSIQVESEEEDLDRERSKETLKKIIESSFHDESGSESDVDFEDDFVRTFGGYD